MKTLSKKMVLPILLLGVFFSAFLTYKSDAASGATSADASPCNWKFVGIKIYDTYVVETHHCVVGGTLEACICGSTRDVRIPRAKPADTN
jgi:hypothetical protein